jgi:hypothetical protein
LRAGSQLASEGGKHVEVRVRLVPVAALEQDPLGGVRRTAAANEIYGDVEVDIGVCSEDERVVRGIARAEQLREAPA